MGGNGSSPNGIIRIVEIFLLHGTADHKGHNGETGRVNNPACLIKTIWFVSLSTTYPERQKGP